MGVDTGIPSGSREILVLSVRDVGAVLGQVLLGQSEVDDVQLVTAFPPPHQEVVRLEVPVQKVSGVHVFHSLVNSLPGEHLVHQHQNGLKTVLAVTQVEEIL